MYKEEFKRWTRKEVKEFCEDEKLSSEANIQLNNIITNNNIKIDVVQPLMYNPQNNLSVLTLHILLKNK